VFSFPVPWHSQEELQQCWSYRGWVTGWHKWSPQFEPWDWRGLFQARISKYYLCRSILCHMNLTPSVFILKVKKRDICIMHSYFWHGRYQQKCFHQKIKGSIKSQVSGYVEWVAYVVFDVVLWESFSHCCILCSNCHIGA
jgi:hypothetical protein